MSEISLRDYLARLEQLAQAGSADEVLWHARHILQYYPKNVDAYRFIGRALVALGRWDEANATLRRVLSVLPNDKTTHLLLSTAYERQHRVSEAVWHLERAFEQDPNDSYLIDELKRLYREHRQIANPRIQFTTAAVARQNIRSRDFDRAIEALRAALKRSPQRGDLRLLLAEALWQRGSSIDAAETALDVLQSYPDCLEANRMLASLWLAEQRPSDARRHLNRVEAVDPYLALELVQGQPADSKSFVLPELDYQQRVQAAMVAEQPDWLQNIDLPLTAEQDEPVTESPSRMIEQSFVGMQATSTEEPQEDWLSNLDSIEMSYQLNTSALQASTSPLSSEETGGLASTTPDLNTGVADDDEALEFDWAGDMGAPSTGSLDFTYTTPKNAAPLTEQEPQLDFEPDADDPFAWMNADTSRLSTSGEGDEPAPSEIRGEDPLAWLRSSGIEVNDNAPSPASVLQEMDDIVYEDPETTTDADPLNWLKDYNTEANNQWSEASEEDENAILSPLVPQGQNSGSQDTVTALKDTIEEDFPMPDLDMIVDDWSEKPPQQETWSATRAPHTMPLVGSVPKQEDEDAFATPLEEWELNERLLNDSLGLEALSEAANAPVPDTADLLVDDTFATVLNAVPNNPPTSPLPPMSDSEWEALDQALSSESSSSGGDIMSDSQRPDLEWDDETPTGAEEQSTGATGMLNWLNTNKDDESAPSEEPVADESTGSTGMLSWLAQGENPSYDVTSEQISTSDDPTGSTGILNWLSQNRPVPPTVPLGQQTADQEFSTENLNIPETPSWLDDLQSENRLESALTGGGDTGATEMLDWLGENALPAATSQLGSEASTGEVLPPDTSWLQEMYDDVQPDERNLPATSEITWDAEQNWHDEPVQESIGEWVSPEILTDQLPDLPLTEPLTSDSLDDAAFGTAPLTSDAVPSTTDETNFAALADWLQTGDLSETPDELPATGVLPTQMEAESSDGLSFAAAVMSNESDLEDDSLSWLSEEPVTEEDPMSVQAEALGFDPFADSIPVEETPAEDLTLDAALEPELEQAFSEAELTEESVFVADASAETSSVDAFANSLLDSGEDQAVPTWMTDVTGEATTAEAFAAEPLAIAAEDSESAIDDFSPLEATFEDVEAVSALEPEAAPEWLLAAAPVAAAAALVTSAEGDDEQGDELSQEAGWDLEHIESVPQDELFEPIAETTLLDDDAPGIAEIEQPEVFYSAFEDMPAAEIHMEGEGSNAPDWLNAMVPGLDIDTAAGVVDAEETLEEDLSDETADAAAAMPDDYEWLNEIVDEETKSDIVVPAVAAQAPRFVFSRPPRWLRRLLERRDADAEAADDSDLPAWLR